MVNKEKEEVEWINRLFTRLPGAGLVDEETETP